MKKLIIYGVLFFLIMQFNLISQQGNSEITLKDKSNIKPSLIVKINTNLIYGITETQGFVVSKDKGLTWEKRNSGLPPRIVYPFNGNGIKRLISIGVDPENSFRILVTTSQDLYLSEDQGKKWESIPIDEPVSSSVYITSAGISPFNSNSFIIGTSFSGIYETKNRGKTWIDLSDLIKQLYKGAGFYEEITGINYSILNKDEFIFACGYTNAIYKSIQNRKSWVKISVPDKIKFKNTYLGYKTVNGKKTEELILGNNEIEHSVAIGNSDSGDDFSIKAKEKAYDNIKNYDLEGNITRTKRLTLSRDKFGIYINSNNSSGDKLDKHIKFLKDNGLNSLVVDMKDDMGWITYNSKLDIPEKIDSIYERFNIEDLVKKTKENNIYLIGRIVVFKDKQLYKYNKNAYSIWDSRRKSPWGNRIRTVKKEGEEEKVTYVQKEFWVDPFCEDVWKYNVAIAMELETLGVDEVQFDYIRFPSDGDMTNVFYRYQKEGMTRIEALESFLVLAREKLSIPISTDLYGFNSWYKMGNWIGQNIEMLSHYVDVICPMYYPSHFPKGFLNGITYLERAEQIYYEGSKRSARIVDGRSVIRPYVQAFLLPFEYYMEKPEYTEYLLRQLKGTRGSPALGFTLWNNSNRYYMVTQSLNDYTKNRLMESPSVLD